MCCVVQRFFLCFFLSVCCARVVDTLVCKLQYLLSAPISIIFLLTLRYVFFPKSKLSKCRQGVDQIEVVILLLAGRCYEAEICAILLPLRCSFTWYNFLPKSNISDFGRKPWTIVRRFDQN